MPMTACIFLNVYFKQVKIEDRIKDGKIIMPNYFGLEGEYNPTKNFWFRPEVHSTNAVKSKNNKGLTTAEFNQTIKEIKSDQGYEFFVFTLRNKDLWKYINKTSEICDCLYCNSTNNLKPLIITPIEIIMANLNNSNQDEKLGERRLNKKQITPIHNCVFLVAYHAAIKTKTNSKFIEGESKTNSPKAKMAKSIYKGNYKEINSISDSLLLKQESLKIQNKLNIPHADVAINDATSSTRLKLIQTTQKGSNTKALDQNSVQSNKLIIKQIDFKSSLQLEKSLINSE